MTVEVEKKIKSLKETEVDKTQLDRCLKLIKNEKLRDWVADFLVNKVPDYFWEIPASSTGKYHPKFAQGRGGLVRHTIVAVWFATQMFDIENFTDIEQDIIIASLILHDTYKHGVSKEKYSVADHGPIAAAAIMEEVEEEKSIRGYIAAAIASHMGKWNKDYKNNKEVAPKPTNELQRFVHRCDYLASRKPLEMNVDKLI